MTKTNPRQVSSATGWRPNSDAVELLRLLHVRRSEEPPVEVVGPRMVGADESGEARALGRLDEAGPAMPTDVVERLQRTSGVPEDEHAGPRDLDGPERARSSDLILPPDALPVPAEEPLDLPSIDGRVGEEGARKGGGLPERAVDRSVRARRDRGSPGHGPRGSRHRLSPDPWR